MSWIKFETSRRFVSMHLTASLCCSHYYVHSKNDVFPFSLLSPLYCVTHPLSPQSLCLASWFSNCMQKAVTSVRLSWGSGFKKTRPVVSNIIFRILFDSFSYSETYYPPAFYFVTSSLLCIKKFFWRIKLHLQWVGHWLSLLSSHSFHFFPTNYCLLWNMC